MNNNKVIIALSSLSVYELNRLQKFINSPYFNKNDSVISHFEYLFTLLKADDIADLTKENLWKHTYPKKSFNDTKFRKLNTDLLKLIEEFLAVEGFQKNPLHKANYLLKAIAKKKIDKLYNSTINTVKRLSKYQLEKSASYYYYQYQIEKNIFSLTTQYERKSKAKSELVNFNITSIAENLDIFFLAEKIKYFNTLFSWKHVAKHEEKILFIDDLIENIEKIDYQSYPILYAHYLVYLTNNHPEVTEHYSNLKKVIEENIKTFPLVEIKLIFDSACNYCVREMNKGNEQYFKELFSLYQFGLSNEILLENEELDPALFRNICITSLKINEYNWTEDFIKDFSPLLNQKYRKNAVTFNLARLYWYEKKFDKVIEQLRDVEYDDIFYNINSKVILLSTYYELDEDEALAFLINSFKVFLQRKKSLPDSMKTRYYNFTRYLERLSKINTRDAAKYKKFIEDVKNEKKVMSKSWLLEKAEELAG